MHALQKPLFALAFLLLACSGPGCQDRRPSESRSESNDLLGLWQAQNQDYTLEAEFYQDATFYYFYSDPSEDREGSGTWKREEEKYVLEVDSGMIYLCDITFDEEGDMTIETESAGTWEFKRGQ